MKLILKQETSCQEQLLGAGSWWQRWWWGMSPKTLEESRTSTDGSLTSLSVSQTTAFVSLKLTRGCPGKAEATTGLFQGCLDVCMKKASGAKECSSHTSKEHTVSFGATYRI